jgi:GTP cyclohydrolase I
VLPKQENLQTNNQHDKQQNGEEIESRLANLSRSYLNLMYAIGEDPTRQGLQKTPVRAAEAFLHFTKGYKETINGFHSVFFFLNVFVQIKPKFSKRSNKRCHI